MVAVPKIADTRRPGKLPTPEWSELYEARMLRGDIQVEAARALKITQSTYSLWETCESFPGIEYAEALAAYMNYPVERVWLMILKNYLSRRIEKLDI